MNDELKGLIKQEFAEAIYDDIQEILCSDALRQVSRRRIVNDMSDEEYLHDREYVWYRVEQVEDDVAESVSNGEFPGYDFYMYPSNRSLTEEYSDTFIDILREIVTSYDQSKQGATGHREPEQSS